MLASIFSTKCLFGSYNLENAIIKISSNPKEQRRHMSSFLLMVKYKHSLEAQYMLND
jgi:hypothetical protein